MRTHEQTATAWDVAHALYAAYETPNRELAEFLLADDFTFSSPLDPYLDRTQYFERRWPQSDVIKQFRFLNVLEQDGEVVVTYELEKTDGTRGRTTDVLRRRGWQDHEDGRVLRAVALARCQ